MAANAQCTRASRTAQDQRCSRQLLLAARGLVLNAALVESQHELGAMWPSFRAAGLPLTRLRRGKRVFEALLRGPAAPVVETQGSAEQPLSERAD